MLIGRAAERAAIEGLLTRAGDSDGGVLLLRGEAGAGKSTLLAQAAQVEGFRVLQATGVEAESELAYATVHQLFHPLLPLLDQVPGPQADAVRVALGMDAAGRTPDRFLVALGFLSLVSEAARERPLLLVLDDLQWCDRASVDAVLFLGRRLTAEPVALLLAVRDDPGAGAGHVVAPGFTELVLGGLEDTEVADLVAGAAGARPSDEVASLLAGRTHGNPLALLELARDLGIEQLTGKRPLPDTLPVGDRLGRTFLDRSAGLSPAADDLLLLAAAAEVGEVDLLVRAAGLADPAATVAELEATGLVSLRADRLTFAHPLARSAVLGAATTVRRVDVHRRLAAALASRGEHDRALWHRAAAALGPDEQLADALEDLARRFGARSGQGAAAAAYERAAGLTTDPEVRTRRLLDAAEAAWQSGDPSRARTLGDRAEAGASGTGSRARLLHLRARAASRRGEVRVAHDLLLEAAALLREDQPGAAMELYAEAVEGAAYAGDLDRVAAVSEAAVGLGPGTTTREEFLVSWLAVGNAGLRGRLATDAALLERVLALGERLEDPRLLVWAGISALNLGDVPAMQDFYRRALDVARADGAVASLPYALEHASMSQALAGSYASARSAAEEGLRLAVETEQQRSASMLLAILAFLAATTGDEEDGARYAEEARAIAVPLGLGLPTAMALWATARLDLTAGRYDAAVDRLLTLAGARPEVGHPMVTIWTTPDLVEAAVRAGRQDEVLAGVDRLVQLAEATGRPGAAAAAAWCLGMLGGPEAVERLTTAVEVFRLAPLPLAEARARLALGELLRRDRQPRLAREHLRAAVEGLRQLGARPWADRAAAELRASGESAPAPETNGLETLTPQELQIVRYVSQGSSNRTIAAQLFISPRTVEYHLYNAYPKLGVSSRTQLIGAFPAEPVLAASG